MESDIKREIGLVVVAPFSVASNFGNNVLSDNLGFEEIF